MSEEEKKGRKVVDWEAVEREYRTGVRSLRDIGAEFGCSHVAIKKKADKEGWARDLNARIVAATDAIVTRAEVTNKVTVETKIAEKSVIEANAQMLADKIVNQRKDIQRARATVQRLWDIVDAELNHPEEFERVGVMLRNEDEFGQDKLNDMYMAAISIPQQVKNVKLLADALKTLIELERKVLKIDSMPDPVESAARGAAEGATRAANEATKELLDDILGGLGDHAPGSE